MLAPWQPTSRSRAGKPGATSARCLMTSNTTACVSRYVATTIPLPIWSRPTGTSVLNGRSRPAANLTHRPGKRADRPRCSQHPGTALDHPPRARNGDPLKTLVVDGVPHLCGLPESACAARAWITGSLADRLRQTMPPDGFGTCSPTPSCTPVGPCRRPGHRKHCHQPRHSPAIHVIDQGAPIERGQAVLPSAPPPLRPASAPG